MTTTAQKIENIIEGCTLNRRQGYQAIQQAMRDSAFVLALMSNWKYDEKYAEFQIRRGIDEETAHLYAMCRTFTFNAFVNAAHAFAEPLRRREFETVIEDKLGPEADQHDFNEAVARIFHVISDAMKRHDTGEEDKLHKAQEKAFEEVMPLLFEYHMEVPKDFYDERTKECGEPPKFDTTLFLDSCVAPLYSSVEDVKKADAKIEAIRKQIKEPTESAYLH